jgi:hypothetical protein
LRPFQTLPAPHSTELHCTGSGFWQRGSMMSTNDPDCNTRTDHLENPWPDPCSERTLLRHSRAYRFPRDVSPDAI